MDKQQQITIDITVQLGKPNASVEDFLAENKLEDTKFLIEVAKCPFSSSEVRKCRVVVKTGVAIELLAE